MKYESGEFGGGVSKFFSDSLQKEIVKKLNINEGAILFMVGDKKNIACKALGSLRALVAHREGLTNKDIYKPIWVTEFPMFDYDEDNDRYIAMHHPFTAPRESDIDKVDSDPGNALSRGYDLTMNGHEIAGGSIRIHSQRFRKKYSLY